MNEDEVVEGCVPSAEVDFFGNNSKDSIPDAKYYLVRPKNSSAVYIMVDKPDYKQEPFYAKCAGCKSDMQDYLIGHCIYDFDLEVINCSEEDYLDTLDLRPSENTVVCVFGEEKHVTISEILANNTYVTDNEVAKHYELYNWHIPILLNNEPLKSYIQEHLDEFKVKESKVPSTSNPTKESKGTPVILNKRLLI